MDVMRTGASALGCVLPEANDHNAAGAREIADHLVASFGSMLCYWYHFSHSSRRIHVETDDDSVAGHFLHLLHRRPPAASWVRAMHTSLNLYAEHEFNSSTFTARVIAGTGSDIYSCITGAIGALRGPKHGGANEVALEIQERYATPDEAEADIRRRVANKEIVIGFGHPVYTVSDPRNVIIKRVAEKLGREAGDLKLYDVAERIEALMMRHQEDVSEPRLVQRGELPPHGRAHGHVHAAVRDVARHRAGARTSSSSAKTARSSARRPTTSGRRTASSCRSGSGRDAATFMRRWLMLCSPASRAHRAGDGPESSRTSIRSVARGRHLGARRRISTASSLSRRAMNDRTWRTGGMPIWVGIGVVRTAEFEIAIPARRRSIEWRVIALQRLAESSSSCSGAVLKT